MHRDACLTHRSPLQRQSSSTHLTCFSLTSYMSCKTSSHTSCHSGGTVAPHVHHNHLCKSHGILTQHLLITTVPFTSLLRSPLPPFWGCPPPLHPTYDRIPPRLLTSSLWRKRTHSIQHHPSFKLVILCDSLHLFVLQDKAQPISLPICRPNTLNPPPGFASLPPGLSISTFLLPIISASFTTHTPYKFVLPPPHSRHSSSLAGL